MSNKCEDDPQVKCPSAVPVIWVATLRPGSTSSRTLKREIKVKHRRWFDARDEAMKYFGVEAGELDVVLKEKSK